MADIVVGSIVIAQRNLSVQSFRKLRVTPLKNVCSCPFAICYHGCCEKFRYEYDQADKFTFSVTRVRLTEIRVVNSLLRILGAKRNVENSH